jgi:hypothetical protein
MPLYEFTVHLDRQPTDDELDAIYEAGLDDAAPEIGGGRGLLHVMRRSDSLTEAILTAVADIAKAGFQATGIDAEDLITQEAIGRRVGRTRESVRLLAVGKRGPGGFPAPAVGGKSPLYSWAAVRKWFAAHYGEDCVDAADHDAETLAAADLLLRARLLSGAAGLVSLVGA